MAKNEETVQSLKLMFPDISANRIKNVLVSAKSWEEAVDILVTNHPESGSAVIQSFVDRNLDAINTKVLKIKREDIRRDAVRFYKISMAKKSNLFQKFVVEFEGEAGIDVGALTVEYFTKLFEIVRRDLFETVKSETFLIPKRSGDNLTLFKILGIASGTVYFRGRSIPLFTPLVLGSDNTKIGRRNCWINIERKIHRTNSTQCRDCKCYQFSECIV